MAVSRRGGAPSSAVRRSGRPSTFTKWRRSPGTRRPCGTGPRRPPPPRSGSDAATERSGPRGSGLWSACASSGCQRLQRRPSRRTRTVTLGSARPRQRSPTRLKRAGARNGADITRPAPAATAGLCLRSHSKSTGSGRQRSADRAGATTNSNRASTGPQCGQTLHESRNTCQAPGCGLGDLVQRPLQAGARRLPGRWHRCAAGQPAVHVGRTSVRRRPSRRLPLGRTSVRRRPEPAASARGWPRGRSSGSRPGTRGARPRPPESLACRAGADPSRPVRGSRSTRSRPACTASWCAAREASGTSRRRTAP